MEIKFDKAKIAEDFNGFIKKASDIGHSTAVELQKVSDNIAEKAKQDSYLRRLKKYNPLFPDVYASAEFTLPNMIIIVDDAVRRGIDVCEGSIGWCANLNGMEVLHLYDEAVASSGLQFIPSASCDAVYYVDPFSRNRFIRVDCIFSKAHEEKLAELKHVAHMLGAKRCTIEITETRQQAIVEKKRFSFGGKAKSADISTDESGEASVSRKESTERTGIITAEFEGSDKPKRPKLKWFAHDDSIKRLIDMRCKATNSIKSETLSLSGSSSATMSQKTACAIDNAISTLRVKGSASMEAQAITENSSKLIFSVEF